MVECQMSKVNKVKFLSERTSGVPPVIFYISKEGILKPADMYLMKWPKGLVKDGGKTYLIDIL